MIETMALRDAVRPCKPSYVISDRIAPRNRNDPRKAPTCRRCGAVGEPEDRECWKCGGEEMVA
jgi:hypothetical protein